MTYMFTMTNEFLHTYSYTFIMLISLILFPFEDCLSRSSDVELSDFGCLEKYLSLFVSWKTALTCRIFLIEFFSFNILNILPTHLACKVSIEKSASIPWGFSCMWQVTCLLLLSNSLSLTFDSLITMYPGVALFQFNQFEALWACLVVQMVKIHLQCVRPGSGLWVRKIPWEGNWLPHSSILACWIWWTEEPGMLWSMGLPKSWTLLSHFHFHFSGFMYLDIYFLPKFKKFSGFIAF